MKRYGVIALIAVLVLGLSVYFAACSGGGGGGGGGVTMVSYATSTQAAAGVKSVSGAVALSNIVGDATSMAGGAIPAGYAPSRRAKAAGTSAIANIDPRLKSVVDKMAADFKNPTIQKTIAKARSFKPASALASSISVSVSCGVSGYFTVDGTDSSSPGIYDEFTIDVTYNACREMIGTTYDVLSGSLHASHKYMLDNSSNNESVTATNLNLASYVTGSLSTTDAINGTFTGLYSMNTSSVQTWESDANGSFSSTDHTTGYIYSFNMNNVSGVDVYTPGTSADTENFTANGSFVFDINDGSGSVASITLAYTNFNDKWQYSNVAPNYPEDEWLNGTISLTWNPSAGNDCMPGSVTITTAAGTPMHYNTYLDSCPSSGTVTANNATIEFGTPSGSQVTVTVGGTSQVFTDCYFDGADTCVAGGGSASQPQPM